MANPHSAIVPFTSANLCYNEATMLMQLDPRVGEELFTIPDTFFRASVEQYHQMIDAGVFANDESNEIELLEGQIIYKMAKNRPHTIATTSSAAPLKALSLMVTMLMHKSR